MRTFLIMIAVCAAGIAAPKGTLTAADVQFSNEQLDFFEKQIRPVLAAQCWNCHGPSKQESGLRLDSRANVLKGGDRGDAVQLTDHASSLLFQVVRRDDELKMPPNGQLSADQVGAFARWIDLGLPWPAEQEGSSQAHAWKSHWAFQPVRRPTIPVLSPDSWSSSPVDRFILAKIRADSGSPSAMADRRTLIRRATFDLIGLPPTPREVDDFVDDDSLDAMERLVDRLLASPRYGERWGRYWLDVARYADNKGYVFFEEPSYPWAYTYRDYVIRSLNEDLPYDQFILEQLAADQLDRNGDDRSLAAMGFLTVGNHFMGNVHDIVDDRIDVVMRGLMGITVTCSRCHDHKYDPIPTADYYSLYGVFRSTFEPLVPPLLTAPHDTSEFRRFSIELSLRQQNLDDFTRQKHAALVEGARTRLGEYLLAAHSASERPAIDDFMLIADPGDLNPAMIVRWQTYLEKLAKHAAKADRVSEAEISASSRYVSNLHPVWGPWLALSTVAADRFAAEAAAYCSRINSPGSTTINPLVIKAIAADPPLVSINQLATRYGDLMKTVHQEWQEQLREAVILKHPTPTQFSEADREAIRLELYGDQSPANVPLVFGWGFLSLLPDRVSQGEYQKVLKDVEQWTMNGPGAPARAMVLRDGEPFEPRVFQRGNPNRLGESVPRRFPTAFSKSEVFSQGSGRLEMARAIVDPANPLTSRVFVNRLWQGHFGAGLVRTPADFGMRSDPPTHPELLDWLAAEFSGKSDPTGSGENPRERAVFRRYSVKRMHRLMMTNRAYQQVSDELLASSDPDNRFWRRATRRRLDFEATRDALVFATGQLQDSIGGPSQNLLDGFQPRRTLYLFLNRLDLPGLLSVFDFPSPAATSAQRDTTTIAPQALFLMNGSLTSAVADAVVARDDLLAIASVRERIAGIYRILFQRLPTADEATLAEEFLGQQPAAASWSQFVQALLLTNEFAFVD